MVVVLTVAVTDGAVNYCVKLCSSLSSCFPNRLIGSVYDIIPPVFCIPVTCNSSADVPAQPDTKTCITKQSALHKYALL